MTIAQALAEVRQNIALASRGRKVKLLAVSKTQPLERVKEAQAAGQSVFAENRVQELVPKFEALPHLEWHLIGHLQTNKAKFIVDKIAMLHSLDSIDLARELQKRLSAINRRLPVLVQVNIAEEESKHGIARDEVSDFLDALADFPAMDVQGLMTIGPLTANAEEIRPVFAELREIMRHQQNRRLAHVDLSHLSMGMSGDYVVAIEEGATMVRVGSTIFGQRI